MVSQAAHKISATTEDGAYTLKGAVTDATLLMVTRNANAKWFIPNESEWYKAAYYQPAAKGGDSDSYWLYPMKTNSIPYSDQPPGDTPDNTRVGNFRYDDGLANGYNDGFAVNGQNYPERSLSMLTDAGAYASSPTYYGTFDQGGNVFEWNENPWYSSSSQRIIRGGSWWDRSVTLMRASEYGWAGATYQLNWIGFRVASIPEPNTFVIVAVLAVCLWPRARSWRSHT